MRVFFGSTLNPTWLARGVQHRETPSGMVFNGQRAVQADALVRAAEPKIYDRKNRSLTLEFKVDRQHASFEDALSFCANHAEAFDAMTGTLTIVTEDGRRERTFTFKNAVVTRCLCQPDGVSSLTTYSVVGTSI